MRIDYILKAAAKRVARSGVTFDINRSLPTVSITGRGVDVFMQGGDAEEFVAECEAMSARCESLDFHTIAMALAEPYTEL